MIDHSTLKWNFDYMYNEVNHYETCNVVYKIENTISGKVYIGQTKRQLNKRWLDYKYDLLRPINGNKHSGVNLRLKNSVQKYYKIFKNVEFLKFSILEVVSPQEKNTEEVLKNKEQYYISEYKKTHAGKVCNILDGSVVRSFTELAKCNISMSKKEYYKTEEGLKLKEKLRNMRIGKKASEETKNKISKKNKGLKSGNKHPLYGKTGNLNPMYGKSHTKETIEKIRTNRKGKASGANNHNTKLFCLRANPLVSPEGEVFYEIFSLNAFCIKYNLNRSHLKGVFRGKLKSHKGWKLRD